MHEVAGLRAIVLHKVAGLRAIVVAQGCSAQWHVSYGIGSLVTVRVFGLYECTGLQCSAVQCCTVHGHTEVWIQTQVLHKVAGFRAIVVAQGCGAQWHVR